jgi:PD-(D/E)XK nuclease superfamily protein
LIVSGAIDPERTADRETPIGWALERLSAQDSIATAGDEPIELERGEARFLLRVHRYDGTPEPDADERSEVGSQLPLFGELPVGGAPVGFELPLLKAVPTPPLHDVRRLSYSALSLFERCSYRYFAERVLGLPPVATHSSRGGAEAGLAGTEIGDAVHRLLEALPLGNPNSPERNELEASVLEWYPAASPAELDRIAGLVEAYCASDLARRIAGLSGARAERPFAFEHDGVLLHGRLDVLWRDGARALVLDYKSNVLDGADPSEVVDAEYRVQRLVYALACLRDGAEEVEVVYQFLERPDEVVSTMFSSLDVAELEAELSEAIALIRAGEFHPSPSELVRRSATSTGTCPLSKRSWPTSSERESTRSSSGATPSPARGPSRCSSTWKRSRRVLSVETPIASCSSVTRVVSELGVPIASGLSALPPSPAGR